MKKFNNDKLKKILIGTGLVILILFVIITSIVIFHLKKKNKDIENKLGDDEISQQASEAQIDWFGF